MSHYRPLLADMLEAARQRHEAFRETLTDRDRAAMRRFVEDWPEDEPLTVTCPNCGGDGGWPAEFGFWRRTCNTCDGRGFIQTEPIEGAEDEPEEPAHEEHVECMCPACCLRNYPEDYI